MKFGAEINELKTKKIGNTYKEKKTKLLANLYLDLQKKMAQINKTITEMEDITPDTTQIQRFLKVYYEQLQK